MVPSVGPARDHSLSLSGRHLKTTLFLHESTSSTSGSAALSECCPGGQSPFQYHSRIQCHLG
eukprot:6172426-Pyramimonas_sp.AAC.1